ncbi:MAG TPA: F0F1 ATP synthase subunit B [Patescibacteria group bacterium]|nr:F0F1 ATP synthase subunit B [Patescibacteria group bacterium]
MIESLIPISRIFGDGSSGGIAALGINLKALILQIITFIIVFWLLKRFALDKIVQTLEERRQKIDDGVTLGREMEAEKAKLEDQVKAIMLQARKDADKIIAQARTESTQLIKDAETVAGRKADTLMADAHARIEDDIKRARQGLEQDMLSLVAEATEVIIEEKLDDKKDNALIRRVLQGVKR